MIWLVLLLLISLLINAILIWYTRTLVQKLMFVSENIGKLSDSVLSLRDHLKNIYEMETYYGDQTIQNLIQHTREVCEDIEEFSDIYDLTGLEEGEILDDGKEYEGDEKSTSGEEDFSEKEADPAP